MKYEKTPWLSIAFRQAVSEVLFLVLMFGSMFILFWIVG